MRRPSSSLALAFLGTSLAASTVLAQQPPPPLPRGSSGAPAGPGAAADAAADGPLNFGMTGAARAPRALLRNGWDFIGYQQYDRALTFFREAKVREKELTPDERLRLKQGIERAQRGIRDASIGMHNEPSYALSGRSRAPGALALRSPGPANASTSATASAIEREPIQLTGGPAAAAQNTNAANIRASNPSAPLDPSPAAPAPLPADPEIAPKHVEQAATPMPSDPTPLPKLPVPGPKSLLDLSAAPSFTPATSDPTIAPASASAPPATTPDPARTPHPEEGKLPALPTDLVTDPAPDQPRPTSPPAQAPAPAPPPEAEKLPVLPPSAVNPPSTGPAPDSPPALTPSTPEAPPSRNPAPAAEPTTETVPVPAPAVEPRPVSLTVPSEPAPAPSPVPAAADTPPAPSAAPGAGGSDPASAPSTAPAPSSVPRRVLTPSTDSLIPNRTGVAPSTLSPELRREVEMIAQKQDEEMKRNPVQATPGVNVDDQNPLGGMDTSKLVISRAPSPTEARPIRAIPVPEEFVPLPKREWEPNRKYWAAAATCHYPLYFQDVTLERYGYGVEQRFGPLGRFMSYPIDDPKQSKQRNQIAQPFLSIGRFAFQVGIWPFRMLVDPPWESEYDLGFYRPGDRVPTDVIYCPPLGVGPPFTANHYDKPANSTSRW